METFFSFSVKKNLHESLYQGDFSSVQNYLTTIVRDFNLLRWESICSDIPWFQRFKINLWLKAAIDSSSRANQFELGSDPDSVS